MCTRGHHPDLSEARAPPGRSVARADTFGERSAFARGSVAGHGGCAMKRHAGAKLAVCVLAL